MPTFSARIVSREWTDAFFMFYMFLMAVIRYCTFSLVLRLMPTVIFILPINNSTHILPKIFKNISFLPVFTEKVAEKRKKV